MRLDRTLLVFGATGMLGSAIYNHIALGGEFNVVGTYRTDQLSHGLVQNASSKLVQCELDPGALNATALIEKIKPVAVINCIGYSPTKYTLATPITFRERACGS